MLFLAIISLLGLKLPVPQFSFQQRAANNDLLSTFTLGIISGITSSCCAPVLIGVITLSSLSPTMVQSLGVGASYVFGMVAPLYLASLLIEKRNLLKNPLLKRKLTVLQIGHKTYPILVSNLIAAAIFFLTGGLTIILATAGMLGMPNQHSPIIKTINQTALKITALTQQLPGINLLFALIGIYLLYRLLKAATNN